MHVVTYTLIHQVTKLNSYGLMFSLHATTITYILSLSSYVQWLYHNVCNIKQLHVRVFQSWHLEPTCNQVQVLLRFRLHHVLVCYSSLICTNTFILTNISYVLSHVSD
jgi:hypothetical protein